MFLIFDTETTGLPRDWNAPITDTDNWPRVVQIAWQLHDEMGQLVEHQDFLVRPDGFDIPFDAERVHGISTELAQEQGQPLEQVLARFTEALNRSEFIVGQNIGFDINVMGAEFIRAGQDSPMVEMPILDTCTERTAEMCQLPGGRGGKFKLPNLTELHHHLFQERFEEAHNATADVEATTRCFFELVRLGHYPEPELQKEPGFLQRFREENPTQVDRIGLKHVNLKKESDRIRKEQQPEDEGPSKAEVKANMEALAETPFLHIHNHSQYSILQSTTEVAGLVKKAIDEKMPAVALTDLGNMMGAFHFVSQVMGHNKSVEDESQKIKPIVGCELYVCRDRTDKNTKDNGYQIVFLAKNKRGYHNLSKLSSIGYIEGFYYVPRVDREVIVTYKEDLIVTTGGLQGEVPYLILNVGEKQAEEAFLWWKEQFGEDFYVELCRHDLPEEERVNETLIRFARKHDVKIIAANNTFYLDRTDSNAHDILLCVKEGEKKSTPIGRGRGFRYGFPNDQFYFKGQEEMKKLFADLPEAIENLQEIVDKVEPFDLHRDVLLPAFEIPEQFRDAEDEKDGGKRGENAYLRHLTYEGAKKRYGEITDEIVERLDFELDTIANTGYPGYFLIVQDFCNAARDMGVSVGPGRGSAAGSAVAYCIGITNVDPIEYDLLFERFLNPERVSLPDIDIDFDDEGRGKVIQYVIDKYGSSQVAQIITYGTMAAKSSIRDTGRVLDLPLPDTDRIAKLVPDIKLGKLFGMSDDELKSKLNSDQMDMARQLKEIAGRTDLEGQTINQARVLEGSVRSTGIHACGVIITPSDIREHIPVATAKDSEMWCTQFDNSVVESAGLLKMDFLGLKTLTIIKEACRLVKERHDVVLDPDTFPLDDTTTYELFQRGETIGVFQYESPGMQKYLRELKPTVFADLIAMNALYRPGPLEYIPSFIKRKHGVEEITYDLPEMEEYLKETYGITVYQEQVMLLSQKLAGFTKGEADVLRKAMGKKIFAMLEKLKPKFVSQAKEKGHPEDKLEKIWKDWEAFASYAFNKSHSTCYAWVAYQTAYIKAHYPAEYMAAVLSNNLNNITEVTFFMEECRRMGVNVLGPDVNESAYKFTVNEEGAIRFGLGGMKGVGESAVEHIVAERMEHGNYSNIFDFLKRIDLRIANKKTLESLALGGAFDSFSGAHRAMYFQTDESEGRTFLEKAIKYAQNLKLQEESAQVSLFGGESNVQIPEPAMPVCPAWPRLVELKKEKEVLGMYLSSHPLDDFLVELRFFCNGTLKQFGNIEEIVGREITLGGIVTAADHRISKNGSHFGKFTLEDYESSHEFFIGGDDYLKYRHFLQPDQMLFMKVRITKKVWEKNDQKFERIRTDFTQMMLLEKVIGELASGLELKVSLSELSQVLIDELREVMTQNPGTKRVKMKVYDPEHDIEILMPSRKLKVEINRSLIDRMRRIEPVRFKVV
ncbi:MAG: DNA polymerase III subunit alpha [Bacteroidota bacterium]|nr:DNA polymerase III subunit alpha [Bacteroidota bacterium]